MNAVATIARKSTLQVVLLAGVFSVVMLFARLGAGDDLRLQLKNAGDTVQKIAQECSLPQTLASPRAMSIAQAYLSVEQVARGPMRQRSEIYLAQILWLFGYKSPAHTLGIGQIAENTFERENLRWWLTRNVAKNIQNAPFWKIAEDHCLSLAMTYRLTELYLVKEGGDLTRVLDQLHGTTARNAAARDSRIVYDYLFSTALAGQHQSERSE